MRSLFDEVDLGHGVGGVIVDVLGCPPGAPGNGYLVEVFLCKDSMGDGVVTMFETTDGSLEPAQPEELARVLAEKPNTLAEYERRSGTKV